MAPSRSALSLDRLGSVVAVLICVALFGVPFATYRATRIAGGEARMLIEALPGIVSSLLIASSLGIAMEPCCSGRPWPGSHPP